MDIITDSYKQYYSFVRQYIYYRINHKYDAEDLAQDVFIRLLDYRKMLRKETVKYFIFTIARNMLTDYLRRYYKKEEVYNFYIQDTSFSTNETEETIIANDIRRLENMRLSHFPVQRRLIYQMSHIEELDVKEISLRLQISHRTVENHLCIGRRIMREYMKKSI